MGDLSDLESLQVLHLDLLALSESRLCNVDRLWAQLEARITEFRKLLDKAPRTEQSRRALSTGKITVNDVEYQVNEQFQQNALQVADDLNLDELCSAQLVLESTYDAEVLGRSIVESSIIRFHQKRQYLLDCYRLVLQQSNDLDGDSEDDPGQRLAFRNAVTVILDEDDTPGNGSKMVRKCLHHMGDIKLWLQTISDKFNGASVLGQSQVAEIVQSLEYQRVSLIQQHESLSMIIFHLIKGAHSTIADFEHFLGILRRIDKYDNLLVHHFLAAGMFIATFGGSEGSTLREARRLNDVIIGNAQEGWQLHYVHAVIIAWWLGEYSGRYGDGTTASPLVGINLDEENKARTRQFTEALRDGAFDFLLSLSADVKSLDWLDPARHGLRQWLRRKVPTITSESIPFAEVFQDALMEQLESFVDAFITNMPDVLRRLRTDEDEQRQLSQIHEHDLDLERFLVIISYAFEGRADAALSLFWSDSESNLAGFLQWASRRASTPLMSAFCEMLQALSESDECASAAHDFLLDEGSSSTGKIKRNHSLTWSQIFRELKFFTEKIRDRPALPQSSLQRSGKPDTAQAETEPESQMMLESYLRLITRLCTESTTARNFVLKHQTFHILEILYQLASSAIPSRLRACAFSTLQSLTSHKRRDDGEHIWSSLDAWVSGGYSPGSTLPRGTVTTAASLRAMHGIFAEIGAGFEEPIAFVQLLTALVAPYDDDTGLNDCLPFPESLGSANRMPGIDPYVDFTMKDVFATRTSETSEAVQLRLIRLSCLSFMKTCLSTFNEDLVVFANRSNISVDGAIRASDLSAYVCLHPFARVMEWAFNDKVMAALFESNHQDPSEIASASPDSPIVLCLMQAIEVVTLILDLQTTYLNIVRPAIKLQPTHRRNVVANAAFASFEDGILNHLTIFADLGLYIGVGHSNLTLSSLRLLQKLSIAPKLSAPAVVGDGRHFGKNKAILVLESSNEGDRIARALLNELISATEVALGTESIAFTIKVQILDFLISCLEAAPDRPTIAHLFLGFQCGPSNVDVGVDSPFSRRDSIFHATVDFIGDGLIGDDQSGISSSLTALRNKGLHLLKILWKSPMTSELVMGELQDNDFLALIIAKEAIVDPYSLWDGLPITDNQFLSTPSADCLSQFLASRSSILQYAASELRSLSQQKLLGRQQTALKTLLGSTIVEDGQQLQHSNVFQFFDFMELDIALQTALPELPHIQDLDFSVCIRADNSLPHTYDLKWVQEMLTLRKSELRNNGQLPTLQEEAAYEQEVRLLMTFLVTKNHMLRLQVSRMQTMDSWVQLMLVIVKVGGLTGTNKTEFILRALQVVLPKLEKYASQNLDETLELSKLVKLLLFSLEFTADTFQQGNMGDLASDRLFDLFRLCLRAIHSPIANAPLKETLYCISHRYLTGMSDVLRQSKLLRRHSVNTIKAAGEKLLDVICDDAYAGDQTCRILAILLLGSFVSLADIEGSKYMVESLVRLNSLSLMVDSLKNIPEELADLNEDETHYQLAYYNAKLALLFRISQTRFGAGEVLNAGLFQSVKASRLFEIDPDLGLDINDKRPIEKHYALLLAIMRGLNATVISRGQQNQQVMAQGRRFLAENRLSIITVLKRSARLGPADDVIPEQLVEDLAETYMILMSCTKFLDFEEEIEPKKSQGLSFT